MNDPAIGLHARRGALAALVAAALLTIGGCSSSDSDSPTATEPAAADTTGNGSGAAETAPASEATGGGVALPVADASYSSGRIHVEFGGDSGGAVEIDGTGVIIGGFANLTFIDPNGQASVVFAFGGDEPGAAMFTWDGITSGGEFGKECTISLTTGDATALEGEFTCTGMAGVGATSTDVLHVDATGTFKLAA